MHIDVAARVFYISGMKQNSHPSDPDRLLQAALRHAAFDGWTDEMVRQAGADAGLSSGVILLAAPRPGFERGDEQGQQRRDDQQREYNKNSAVWIHFDYVLNTREGFGHQYVVCRISM